MPVLMPESLATLLCSVYAVELKCIEIIRAQLEAADCPDARKRIKAHLIETQWQIKLLDACLEFQGIDRALSGTDFDGLASKISRLSLFEIKRFEIELYKKVIAAAREHRAPEVLQACREILEQERAMAEWVQDNYLPRNAAFPENVAVAGT
jgi:ferritin-like metal-binding protein YciE